MGVYLAEQTTIFLQAIVLGFVYGLLYDVFRITRIAIPTAKWVVFAQDVLYFFICAVGTFFFLLRTMDGQVRFFILLGAILGMTIYFYTLSIIIMGVSAAIIRMIRAVLRWVYRWIFLPTWWMIYSFVVFIMRPVRFLGALIEKTVQRCKYGLKVRHKVLYNQMKGKRTVMQTQMRQLMRASKKRKLKPDGKKHRETKAKKK